MVPVADTRKMILEPGKWWGGYHAPFFISTSMLETFLKKQGFTDFEWQDREKDHPLPKNVNPKADPKYSDDWEAWVSANYKGARRTVEIPHYDYVDWVLRVPEATFPNNPAKPPEKPPGIDWSEVFIVGAILWLLSKRKERRR